MIVKSISVNTQLPHLKILIKKEQYYLLLKGINALKIKAKKSGVTYNFKRKKRPEDY
jgi:hypothetical protein